MSSRGRQFLERVVATVAVVVGLACISWPLPVALTTHLPDAQATGRPFGSIDLDLVVWILAWGSHALVAQPLAMFQANIFYPAPDALASSEHLIGLLPVAAPAFLLSDNAVLAYNATLLAVVFIGAFGAWALVRDWTGSLTAGLVAAAAFAFSPIVVQSWIRLHESAVHLFPLLVLYGFRAAANPRWPTLLALSAVVALQAASGVYIAFQTTALLAAMSPALWWVARRSGQGVLGVSLAIAGGCLVLAPLALPYLRAQGSGTLTVNPMVALPGLPEQLGTLMNGLTVPAFALAFVGILCANQVSRARRAGLFLIALLGFALSLGPRDPLVPGTSIPSLYSFAAAHVPGFAVMRWPARFLTLPVFALAAAAGLGADWLARRCERWRELPVPLARIAIIAVVVLLVVARMPSEPIALQKSPLSGGSGDVARWLAANGGGEPVLVLPVYASLVETASVRVTTSAMIESTLHWAPLLNGFSGYSPRSYPLIATLARLLPDRDAFDTLCRLVDMRWIVLRRDRMRPRDLSAWSSAAATLGMTPVFRNGQSQVYRVETDCGELTGRLREELHGSRLEANPVTLGGVPQTRLATSARQAAISGSLPSVVYTSLLQRGRLTVTNVGSSPWPGLSIDPGGRVGVASRVRDLAGKVISNGRVIPVGRDLAPGESAEVEYETYFAQPGAFELEVGIIQEGLGWFVDDPGGTGSLRSLVEARHWNVLRRQKR